METNSIQTASAEANELHTQIIASPAETLTLSKQLGDLLKSVKADLLHGSFTEWCKTTLTFSGRTARDYMRISDNWDKLEHSDADSVRSAMQLLKDINVDSLHAYIQSSSTDKDSYLVDHQNGSTDKDSYLVDHQNGSTDKDSYLANHQNGSTDKDSYLIDHQNGSTDKNSYLADRQNDGNYKENNRICSQNGGNDKDSYLVDHQNGSTDKDSYFVDHQNGSTDKDSYLVDHQNGSTPEPHINENVSQQVSQIQNGSTDKDSYLVDSQNGSAKPPKSKKGPATLFPNAVEPAENVGIVRQFSDRYSTAVKLTSNEALVRASNQQKRNTFTYQVGASEVSMTFDDPGFKLRTFDAFYNHLLKIRDAKTIQVICALFDFAAVNGAWQLQNISINDLMKSILKPPKSGYFSQEERRDFSDVLYFLSELKLSLDTDVREGRKKRVLTHFYRVFDLRVALYAKKRNGHPDLSVILRFNGELLPGFNKGVHPARLYGKGLLHYDANKDRNAVLLSFLIQTRLSQVNQTLTENDELKPCRVTRGELMRFCDYGEDKLNRNRANIMLKRTLDKLIEFGDIMSYHPDIMPLDDGGQITFFPVNKNVKGAKMLD